MNYINIYKRKLVNSVNQISKHKLIFDFDTTEFYEFKILDKYGKQIKISDESSFYICGSTTTDNKNIIFFSDDFVVENDVLIFKINSNTKEYLEKITDRNVHIYIEIAEVKNGVSTVLLMDEAEANNRLYTTGTPQPIQLEKYYTKTEIDSLLSSFDFEESDPIYSADKKNIVFKGDKIKPADVQSSAINTDIDGWGEGWITFNSNSLEDDLNIIVNWTGNNEKSNAIKHEEFDTRLIALEENTSSGNITVNNIAPDETGNIVLTTDEIISNYSGNNVSITQQLQYFEENIWSNVEQELRNYVKTINNNTPDENGNLELGYITVVNGVSPVDEMGEINITSDNIPYGDTVATLTEKIEEIVNENHVKTVSGMYADQNGDIPGIVVTVNNICADDRWGNLWLYSTNIPHHSAEQSVGDILDDLIVRIGNIQSILDAINGEVK